MIQIPKPNSRHIEALGLAAIVVGIGWVWLPGGIIVGGLLLVAGAQIRSMRQ